eukprot:15473931-Alexandrium_andersonii.AAC.1
MRRAGCGRHPRNSVYSQGGHPPNSHPTPKRVHNAGRATSRFGRIRWPSSARMGWCLGGVEDPREHANDCLTW